LAPLKQLARKRIERLDAIAIAYICQLLLNSLSPLKKELRGEDVQDSDAVKHAEFFTHLQASMKGRTVPRGSGPSSTVDKPAEAQAASIDRPS
jgi:hypothetical protein